MDDLDLETDGAMIQFAPSAFSPYDIFDADDWPRFTLTGAEMAGLAAQAPPELKGILGSSEPGDIEAVSFEYRSVAVTRPWFRPGVFRSRFWRLPAGSEELSDGLDLGTGTCPAYVSAVVFARRIEVTMRPQASGSAAPDTRLLLALDPEVIRIRRPDVLRLARPLGAAQLATQPAATASVAPMMAPAMLQAIARLSTVNFVARPQAMIPVGAVPAFQPATAHMVRMRSPLMDRARLSTAEPAPTEPPAPAPPPPTNEIMVLAFICRRVPRAPDPDPSLAWS